MNTVHNRFIEPLDVLFLRGNRLFGDPGSYGESLVPPWPSVVAGALRSRILADDGVDLVDFAKGAVTHPRFGTPDSPGDFAVAAFHLARRTEDQRVEALIAPPADLVTGEAEPGALDLRVLSPTVLQAGNGLACSYPLPLVPVLGQSRRTKPTGGYWLTEDGWRKYLAGKTPKPSDLVESGRLWALDPRIGVGLDAATRRASDGRLFSVQAVVMRKREHGKGDGFDVGFLAAITGAEPPARGTLRFGGDGRGAAIHGVDYRPPEPDYGAIVGAGRCRLVLTTPGLFATTSAAGEGPRAGWLPTGTVQAADGSLRFDLQGVRGRLVCAAVSRAEVISGWDLAKWQPKPAQRAAPTGSVYWVDGLETTPEALRKLAGVGLWGDPCEDPQRRAEGFNRVCIAAWSQP